MQSSIAGEKKFDIELARSLEGKFKVIGWFYRAATNRKGNLYQEIFISASSLLSRGIIIAPWEGCANSIFNEGTIKAKMKNQKVKVTISDDCSLPNANKNNFFHSALVC